MAGRRLIFQLGTNNWQRHGEFAPGSGILHEAHHHAFNSLPGTHSYSIYPSKTQRFQQDDVKVFELPHDIPICESISPVSNYRWHNMSDEDVAQYRSRLTREVSDWMAQIEARTGDEFGLVIAHHTFLNPLVMRDVLNARAEVGRRRIPLICFAHGTALKMFAHEKAGQNVQEFPARFLPMMQNEGVFDPSCARGSVDLVATISNQQVDAFCDIFPAFPKDRVILSPNGYNQDIFQPEPDETTNARDRIHRLGDYQTKPFEGSKHQQRCVDGDIDAVVAFCGKFADWKRLDVLLHAAAIYEGRMPKTATVIVGSGPHEDQVNLQSLALDKLDLQNVYFLGPRRQDELAEIFRCADIGCFPSKNEPFGLVFIECMACGTPVIGANSGGPRDFVTEDVGALVAETDDKSDLAQSLASKIIEAINSNWKSTKGPVAAQRARQDYSVLAQCKQLLEAADGLNKNLRN